MSQRPIVISPRTITANANPRVRRNRKTDLTAELAMT